MEILKQKVYYRDGSLRDIYVRDTVEEDWKKWIEFVNHNYQIKWYNEKTGREENQIDFDIVLQCWNGSTELRSTAKIFIDGIQINAHFFTSEEIENDIDPQEIVTLEDHDKIINYMKQLSAILNKEVILTPENESETVLIGVNENNIRYKDIRDSLFLLAGFIAIPLFIILIFYIFDYLTYETKAEKELWVAKDKLLLADEAFFFPATGTIVIEKNEACIPIRNINEKDFIYTEVLCEHGQGWVIGSSDFNVLYPKKTDLPR